ncbi:serine/threonine-protein kinase PknD [Nocardia sp. NPDC059239]|uniref:serine/threonine-protein kinase PknD n=1 Tax=unclassified Nocardia TaxID=2637762 RepID=UPI00369609C4
MSQPAPDSRVGTIFGHYQLRRLLGRGGMGEVYEAYDTTKDRIVALKLLPEHLATDTRYRERFRRESQTAARLREPHIVPIHDYGEIDGLLYIDMRLVEGGDLGSLLTRHGPMAPARAVAIISQIAAALDAAHAEGLIHRDIKPANILIAAHDFAYLVDFGIAHSTTSTGLTSAATAVGTCAYMAPERFREGEITYRADIYSLACVLHECLTATRPYPGDSVQVVITAHLFDPIPRPSEVHVGTPTAFDSVIACGMAKDPAARYPSAGDLARAANDALTDTDRHMAATILEGNQASTIVEKTQRPPRPPTTGLGGPSPAWFAPTPSPIQHAPIDKAQPPRWRRTSTLWTAVILSALTAAAAVVVAYKVHRTSPSVTPSTPTPTQVMTILPFTGLNGPHGVAVDSAGDLFVTDSGNNRVLKLNAGSQTQVVLPFTGLGNPVGLAVNTRGDVFVADLNGQRVVEMPAGSDKQVVLPITGLYVPIELAVNAHGDLFVTDENNRVLELPAGSATPNVLPFSGLNYPHGVGVSVAGDVFVADSNNNRVLTLPVGSPSQTTVPFSGINFPVGLSVDAQGNVFVTDWMNQRVLKLAAGSDAQAVLPLTGLGTPAGVTTDVAGNVFITDSTKNWVMKLPANASR